VPSEKVISWIGEQNAADLYLTSVTIMEIRKGVEGKRKESPRRANELEKVLDMIVGQYGDRILPLTTEAADLAGRNLAKVPNSDVEDAQIAAIAKANGMTMVTRNVKHFQDFDLEIYNPF
jgi:predicted nucleic acid-binding protein